MMNQWLLDTNTCIAIMNNQPASVKKSLFKHPVDSVAMSVICLYELEYGVNKSNKKAKNRQTLDSFRHHIDTLPWTEECAISAGKLRSELEKKGQLIGHCDMLIAAHALAIGSTLVTNNTKEFKRVRGLKLANWRKVLK